MIQPTTPIPSLAAVRRSGPYWLGFHTTLGYLVYTGTKGLALHPPGEPIGFDNYADIRLLTNGKIIVAASRDAGNTPQGFRRWIVDWAAATVNAERRPWLDLTTVTARTYTLPTFPRAPRPLAIHVAGEPDPFFDHWISCEGGDENAAWEAQLVVAMGRAVADHHHALYVNTEKPDVASLLDFHRRVGTRVRAVGLKYGTTIECYPDRPTGATACTPIEDRIAVLRAEFDAVRPVCDEIAPWLAFYDQADTAVEIPVNGDYLNPQYWDDQYVLDLQPRVVTEIAYPYLEVVRMLIFELGNPPHDSRGLLAKPHFRNSLDRLRVAALGPSPSPTRLGVFMQGIPVTYSRDQVRQLNATTIAIQQGGKFLSYQMTGAPVVPGGPPSLVVAWVDLCLDQEQFLATADPCVFRADRRGHQGEQYLVYVV